MGRLIPAGTGLAAYKSLNLVVEGEPVDESRYQHPSAPPPVQQPVPAAISAVNEE